MHIEKLVRNLLFTTVVVGTIDAAAAAEQPGALTESRTSRPTSDAVLEWHRIATEILPVEVGPILDSRAMSILQAAVHDAVNGIDRRFEPYTADLSFPNASIDAAVASAAHDVLVALAPGQQERIDREYAAALAGVHDGRAKDDGVTLGRMAARANLERRAGDGIVPGPWPPREGPVTEPVYVPTGKPGDYDFTPPFDAPPLGPVALFPGWGRLATFAIDRDRPRYRFDGPDPLRSARYARDFDFLKSFGSQDSAKRSADQTATAFFWFEPFSIWNDIARTTIQKQRLDPWRAARALALVNFAMTDAGIVCFEAKYRFRFWRPYTAIRRAAEDGNDATEPDPDWIPLLWSPPDAPPTFLIPPIPDYPSAAAITSAAAAAVLTAHVGDRIGFEATSPFLPDATRRFKSFRQAARETAMSRVFGGIHFVHAVEDGSDAGSTIGRDVSRLLPRTSGKM